jgi:hypothetical protein
MKRKARNACKLYDKDTDHIRAKTETNKQIKDDRGR